MEIKTYTVKEAELILKVGGKTVRNYIKDGKLPAAKIGRGWVIRHNDLDSFIKNNQ